MTTIPDVIDKFVDYRKKFPTTWGSLHIVVEEENVKDKDVLFCEDWAMKNHDDDAVELSRILLKMSKTQRLCIGARVDALINSSDNPGHHWNGGNK